MSDGDFAGCVFGLVGAALGLALKTVIIFGVVYLLASCAGLI